MKPSQTKPSKFITFGKPDIGVDEEDAVVEVLRSGWIGTGKVCRKFEEEFVQFMGGGYAVGVSSATIGLVISLRAVGICHGSGVLTTPLTFCATVNAILQAGGIPVFKDVDKDGLLSSETVEKSLKGIDAVLPVNYTGKRAIIKKLNVPVIEDAAHSFGSRLFFGSGDLSVFSLYATKNITSGEGGVIWTRNKDLADKCRLLSNHGQSSGAWSRYSSGPIENYQVVQAGYKGNLPDILAAIGLAQLRRWPELKAKRDMVWKIYEKAFGEKGINHSQHLYTIRVKNRAKVREELFNKGIATGVHYGALHLEPAYDFLGYKKGDFPMAEMIGTETLSLPVSNSMTEEDAHRVVEAVNELA